MLRDVEAEALFLGRRAQGRDRGEGLYDDPCSGSAVRDGGKHRDGLDTQLREVAEQRAVRGSVPALLRQNAGEQRQRDGMRNAEYHPQADVSRRSGIGDHDENADEIALEDRIEHPPDMHDQGALSGRHQLQ